MGAAATSPDAWATLQMSCIFCQIVARTSPASIICQDERLMAFMAIRPTTPGECLVIPKAHVDHFTDLDDETAQRIMVVAQRIGRRLRTVIVIEETAT
jgi:histidine triad (HIT) family protein